MYRILAIVALLLMATSPVRAIDIVVDYTYAGSFFSTGTTTGQQARASVEAAADFFSEILEDDFSSIETPDDYISTATGGSPVTYSWDWEMRFTNPSTGSPITISNPTIAENEFRVYVGARELGGNILGLAGPGGWGSSSGGSWYFPSQRAEIDAITESFTAQLENRTQGADDFGAWGGIVAFDTTSNWNYDHTAEPAGGQSDLFSVAIHELGHTFGIGTSDEWEALRSGSQFFGEASVSANGGVPPTLQIIQTSEGPRAAHWNFGTMSTVYGGAASQEASMDPDIFVGTRKVWTVLDAAGLEDIGWQVAEIVAPDLPGDANGDGTVDLLDLDILGSEFGTSEGGLQMADFNGDGAVNLLDLDILGANFGQSVTAAIPEPATLALLVGVLAGVGTRRTSRR